MSKTITMEAGRYNFHNEGPIQVRYYPNAVVHNPTGQEGTWIRLSAGQARRIRKHFCGIPTCQCRSGPLKAIEYEPATGLEIWGVPV